MKRIRLALIFIFLLFVSTQLYSQLWKQYADSAKKYSDQKNIDKAIEFYSKVREELKKDSSHTKTYADYTNFLGSLYKDKTQYDKAESFFLEAKELREKLFSKDNLDYVNSSENMGYIYFKMGSIDKSEIFYLEAKQIREKYFDTMNVDYGGTCMMLGNIFTMKRQFDSATQLLLEAKGIFSTIKKESFYYVQSCFNLAVAYTNLNQNTEAESLYLEAMQIVQKIADKTHPYYTVLANNLAILYTKSSQYQKAESLYIECLSIREKNPGKESSAYAQSCDNLTVLYTEMGQYKKAEIFCLMAKGIREKIFPNAPADFAGTCDNLARLYMYMGDFKKSESLYLKAKEIREKNPGKESPEYALTCNNLATLYNQLGLYDEAEKLHLEAIHIRGKNPGKESADYAQSCNNLGGVYTNSKQYQKAEPFYLEAKQIREKLFSKQSPSYASTCNNLAILYNRINQYEKAESYYIEAKQIREKILGINHPDYATTCNDLAGLYYQTGQYNKSELLYSEAKRIREKILGKEHPSYAESCDFLANVYWAENKLEIANKLYTETFELQNSQLNKIFEFTSETEKQSYIKMLPDFQNYYLSFIIYNTAQFNHSLSYNISLLRRNLILSSSQQLHSSIFNSTDTTLKNKYDKWIDTRQQLSFWYAKPIADRSAYVKDLEEQSNTLEKDLTRSSSDFKNQQSKNEITWKNIQQNLKPNEATIEFADFNFFNVKRYTDSIYYIALLLRKDKPQPQLIKLFEKKQLDSLLNNADDENNLYAENNSLYNLIWKPMERSLKGITKIYFAPSGNLHTIAFAALPIGNNKVLSDKYQLIELNTTASVTDQVPSFINTTDSIQLYGGIKYDADSIALKQVVNLYASSKDNIASRSIPDDLDRGSKFNYLPGTEDEINSIKKQSEITNNHVNILAGINATEESFKALNGKSSPAVIHIATHGFFAPNPKEQKDKTLAKFETSGKVFKQSDNPLFRSGLLFAGANYTWTGKPIEGIEDGILTAYEVSNMYLPNTKLVVLSACETGLGDIEGSEGVYGLQRAFKIAGVKNLVMSLWKVPDVATSEFMQTFYKNLFAKESISDAFYHAQTTMKNKYRNDPYKWAAWVLTR